MQSLDSMYIWHLQSIKGSGVVSRFQHMGYTVLLARIDYYRDKDSTDQGRGDNPVMPAAESDPGIGPGRPETLQIIEFEGRLESDNDPSGGVEEGHSPLTDLDGRLESNADQSLNDPHDLKLGGGRQANEAEDRSLQGYPEANTVAYVLYFYGAQYAYRVASIGPRNATSLERDIQQSVLDSFGFEDHNHWHWGPVSSLFIQYDHQDARTPSSPGGGQEQLFSIWRLGDYSFRILRRSKEEQVARQILEREKRILQAVESIPRLYPYALARFYYMNFRQNFALFKDFAVLLRSKYRQHAQESRRTDEANGIYQNYRVQDTDWSPKGNRADKQELSLYEYLLYDLQDLLLDSGRNTETVAGISLELPSRALEHLPNSNEVQALNIETLALVYNIINAHFQHNGLILYAPKYSQLLVGVEELNVDEGFLARSYRPEQSRFREYNGISISWYNNRYLVGELTARIYIGWARTPLRDLQNWIPITFHRYMTPRFFP